MAIALTGVFLPALATALVAAHAGRASSIQQLQAQSLIHEATDAVRNIREKGWSNIATDGTYHPVPNASDWSLASGVETINGFTRQVVISTTQRNATGAIVEVGGTNDPSTKHIVVTVSWNTPVSGSLTTDAYLTRWQNNVVWTQTNQADFTGGTLTNTCAVATCDQQATPNNNVQLTDSPATWQLPSAFGTGYNVTGNVSANDVFVATIGTTPYAFVGYPTGMAIVNISNPAAPTLAATYTTSAAVNGIFVSGNYAYLATSITTAQLTIVNVTNPAAPTTAASFRIQDASNAAAMAVYVSGSYAYVVKNQVSQGLLTNYGEINVVNVTTPTNPSLSDDLNIGANCSGVYVNGNFAYVTSNRSNQQLTVVNVTTKTNISSAATVNLGATANAITGNGTSLYIATAANATTGELRIYNGSTTTPSSVGNYEFNAAINGVSVDTTNPNYLALATSTAAKQASIINIATPATPTLVNNITLGGNANDVKISGSFAYFGTADTAKEMTVVYAGYRPTGTFESSTFDPGFNVGYNYLSFNSTVPAGSTLQLQVAANNTNSGWSYIGPDGTSGTFYTTGDSIPLSIVSNRYFRYKAFFTPTSNGQQSPALNDVEVNYSP